MNGLSNSRILGDKQVSVMCSKASRHYYYRLGRDEIPVKPVLGECLYVFSYFPTYSCNIALLYMNRLKPIYHFTPVMPRQPTRKRTTNATERPVWKQLVTDQFDQWQAFPRRFQQRSCCQLRWLSRGNRCAVTIYH